MQLGRTVAAVTLAAALVTGCGGGGSTPDKPDIPGVVVERAPGRNHTNGKVNYAKHPPTGGDHNPMPLTCGYYDQQPPDEFAVHSLEHGAVWIAYDSKKISGSDVDVLRAFAKQDHVIVSPYDGMDVPITLVAWEHRLELQSVSDPRLKQFMDEYRNGAQAPERGSACQGIGQPSS